MRSLKPVLSASPAASASATASLNRQLLREIRETVDRAQRMAAERALVEVSRVLALREAELPGNPRSPVNERLADGLKRDLRRYFRRMEQAVSEDALEMLYLRHVEQE